MWPCRVSEVVRFNSITCQQKWPHPRNRGTRYMSLCQLPVPHHSCAQTVTAATGKKPQTSWVFLKKSCESETVWWFSPSCDCWRSEWGRKNSGLVGLFTAGAGLFLTLLLPFGVFPTSLLPGCFVHPEYYVFALLYYNILCHVWLIYLGSLLFSKRKQRICWPIGRVRYWGGNERRGRSV